MPGRRPATRALSYAVCPSTRSSGWPADCTVYSGAPLHRIDGTMKPDEPMLLIRFDGEGRVASDLPCSTCGYNLRMLAVAGICPECGAPVQRSITALVDWLINVSFGADAATWAFGALAAAGACSIAIPWLSDPTRAILVVIVAATVCAALPLLLGGAVCLTTAGPGTRGRATGLTGRLLLRASLGTMGGTFVTLVCLSATIPVLPPGGVLGSTVIIGMLALFGLSSAALLPLVFRHLGVLMRRVAKPHLERIANRMLWVTLALEVMIVAVLMTCGLLRLTWLNWTDMVAAGVLVGLSYGVAAFMILNAVRNALIAAERQIRALRGDADPEPPVAK